jgi:hypothetical protein
VGVTSIAASDLDGDGKQDLVLASEAGGSVVVMHNTTGVGGISFAPPQTLFLLPSPADMQIGDLSGDGLPDLVSLSASDSRMVVYSNVSTPGAILFMASCSLPTPTAPSRVVIGDLNADASLDAAVVTTGGIVALYRNVGVAGCMLQQGIVRSFGGSSHGLATGDLTGDNKADLAIGDFTGGVVHIFQNTLPEATEVALRAGWNMVSVPRQPASFASTDIFPTAASFVFGFTGTSYVARDTMAVGPGYWVLYLVPTLNVIGGLEVTSAYLDVPLGNRWYLIGSLTSRFPRTALFSEPPDAFSGNEIFGLVGGAYLTPDFLEPGFGYWVFVNQPCRIRLQSQ